MKTDSIKEVYTKYEHYISPLALLAGFIWDSLTLRRVDLWIENLVMIIYLAVAGMAILLINVYNAGRFRGHLFDRVFGLLPFVLQFAFGGLFSAFVVFYSKSAALITSWPFLLFLATLLVGNEVFRQRYLRLVFQVSIFFIAVYSYSIFAVPVLVNKIGLGTFLLSGLMSVFLIGLFIWSLSYVIPSRFRQSRSLLFFSIGLIYVAFHIFYFTNLIPPIPLSLKESGIYHKVERTASGQYLVTFEPSAWYQFFKDYNSTFHWLPGQLVYSYSAVFAPAKLNTVILHRWSYFNDSIDDWVVADQMRYSMVGGRDGGYRGYSFKQNIVPGKWRVDIITERGQVLGRMTFRVVQTNSLPEMKTALR